MQTNQPEAQPLLKLEEISYRYPSMPSEAMVIKGVSLRLSEGDVVKIAGRNGTGKTTLLKLITGELTPITGSRLVLKAGLRCAYLDQHTGDFLGEALTVREQLAMSLSDRTTDLQPVRRRLIDEKLKAMLNVYSLHLEDRLDTFTCELSGGQRQIVALLAVLQRQVDILALDEFTAYMDTLSVAESVRILERIRTHGKTAFVVAGHEDSGIPYSRLVEL